MNIAYALSDFYHSFGSPPIYWKSDRKTSAFSASDSYTPALQKDQFSEYELYDIPGWDGYDALPILQDTVVAARAMYGLLPMGLHAPDIAPGADGTIGFEWRSGPDNDRTYFTIEVGPGDRVVATRYYPNGKIWRSTPTSILTGARALFTELHL